MRSAAASAGARWTTGNRVELLENGEAFYRRVFAAIDAARRELQLETFILFEDEVGWALHGRLLAAARRGVRVQVLVDGYGSPAFSPGFLDPLAEAGVDVRAFGPAWLGLHLSPGAILRPTRFETAGGLGGAVEGLWLGVDLSLQIEHPLGRSVATNPR